MLTVWAVLVPATAAKQVPLVATMVFGKGQRRNILDESMLKVIWRHLIFYIHVNGETVW